MLSHYLLKIGYIFLKLLRFSYKILKSASISLKSLNLYSSYKKPPVFMSCVSKHILTYNLKC